MRQGAILSAGGKVALSSVGLRSKIEKPLASGTMKARAGPKKI
jgi:hypothetical protein